jgi:hypothetical protein
LLRAHDCREHIRRGAKDQFQPQQGRLGVVLRLELARLGPNNLNLMMFLVLSSAA